MKTSYYPIIILILLISICSYTDSLKTIELGRVTSKSRLVLREKPSIQSSKIDSLYPNWEVEILEYSKHSDTIDGITAKWVKVRLFEKIGWAFSGYIEVEKKYNLNEIISLMKSHEIVFRESSECSGSLPSEYYTYIHFYPDKTVKYEYTSSSSCPNPKGPDCAAGFDGSTRLVQSGKYSIGNNSIIITFNKYHLITEFDSTCCDKKNNENIQKDINESYRLQFFTCDYNGYERIALKGDLPENKLFEYVLDNVK